MKILDQVTVGSGSIHMYLVLTKTYEQSFCPCLCLCYYYYFFKFTLLYSVVIIIIIIIIIDLLIYFLLFNVLIHCIPAAKEILYFFAIKFHLSVTKFIFYFNKK